MPSFKFVFILMFPLTCIMCLEPMVKNSNNYGLFTLSYDHCGECKGPKSKDLAIMKMVMNRQSHIANINFTFLVDAKIDEIKIQVLNIKDNKRNFLWNYKVTDPCKHYAIAVIIKQQLDATNCLVKKGNYTCVINFEEVTTSFLGTSFFYGTYAFKAVITSKNGNIACFNATPVFKKKSSL